MQQETGHRLPSNQIPMFCIFRCIDLVYIPRIKQPKVDDTVEKAMVLESTLTLECH